VNAGDEIQRHLVVFDCNVYLDAASLLGEPFSWGDFEAAVARLARVPVPHPQNGANDSLRALAACTSGRFAGDEALEVWTSTHIDTIVRGKARQSAAPHPETGYRGLGWSKDAAQALVDDLVYGLVDRSGGGSVGDLFPDGNPPLDHEDGMVFGACRYLAGDDPLAHVYCVTRDRGFIEAFAAGALSRHSHVMPPAKFVALLRRARFQYSVRRMSK
jgi:hypothetical protein